MDPSKGLNELWMDVTFAEGDRVADPMALRACLESSLASTEALYVEQKERWKATVGFEDLPVHFSVTMSAASQDEFESMLADWGVGLRKDLPIESIRAEKVRFGIPEPLDELQEVAGGSMELQQLPSIGETVVQLTDASATRLVRIGCMTHASARVVPLPSDRQKVRLTAPLISFTLSNIRGPTVTLACQFELPDGDDLLELGAAARVGRTVDMFARAGTDGLLVRMTHGANVLFSSDLTKAPLAIDQAIVRRASAFVLVDRIVSRSSLDVASVRIRPREILRRQFQLCMLAASFDRTLCPENLAVGSSAPQSVEGKRAALRVGCVVPLEHEVVAAIVTVQGIASWKPFDGDAEGEVATVALTSPGAPEARYFTVLPRADWDPDAFHARLEAVADELEREGVEVVIG